MNFNKPLLIGVSLTVFLLGLGIYLVVKGSLKGDSLADINSSSSFTFLEKSCVITSATHTFETKRKSRSCGSDCYQTDWFCEDQVQYTFLYDTREFSSRISITERNEKKGHIWKNKRDQCTVNADKEDNINYQGYLDNNMPFVCVGICQDGTYVDCWKPTIAYDQSNYTKWANCGNSDCMKLVDPKYEIELAQLEHSITTISGYVLIGFGCAVAIFITFFLCGGAILNMIASFKHYLEEQQEAQQQQQQEQEQQQEEEQAPSHPTTWEEEAQQQQEQEQAAAVAVAVATNPKEEWKSLAPMTSFRARAGGILIHDQQFLVIGGQDETNKLLSSCEYYDTKNTETWKSLPINMPTGRISFGIAKVDNNVYVMGGRVGSNYNSSSVRSDLISIDVSGNDLSALSAANKWNKTLAPMNHTRCSFAGASHLNFIYVFGGYTDRGYERTNTAERYNINTNQWEELPDMPSKRTDSSAGVVGNKIYVVGGRDRHGNELSTTLVFDTSTQQWEPSTAVPDMKTTRTNLSVVIVDHFVLAIGGYSESGDVLSTIEVLDTQRSSWTDAPTPIKHGRYDCVAKFVKETNAIIIAGGRDDTITVLNTADSISF